MKKSLIFLALLLLARIADAAVTDAPHNDSNLISCISCHSYSVWWQYSPVQSDTIPEHGRTEQVNTICLSCHGDDGPEISANPHSSVGMTSLHRGTLEPWSRICTDCHDPHFQAQLDWQAGVPTTVTETGPYLVVGTMAGTATVSGDGTADAPYASTLQFSPPLASKDKWGNDTIKIANVDTRRWTAKSGTAERGLILVLADGPGRRTFEITGATDDSITVNGNIPATSFPAGTPFGLIYGQLIRSKIDGPIIPPATKGVPHDVKFFDPNGGFVDTSASKDGLCQVCHSLTNHFQYNATNASNDHEEKIDVNGASGAASRCTQCHTHGRGFAPGTDSGKHPEHLAMGVSCEVCHIPGGPAMDPLTATGCSTCHQDGHGGSPNDGGTYRDNWFNLSTSYALACNSCHTLPPNYTSGPAKANSHSAHTVFTCNTCHFATTADGTTITATAKHLNKTYDVTPDGDAGVTFTYTSPLTTGAGGTCSNISCHANTEATWGAAQDMTCQVCHLGTTDGDDFSGTFYNNNLIAKIAGSSEWGTTGHGRAEGNYSSGNVAANFAVSNACLYCHDNTIGHKTAANPFRLKNFNDQIWGKNGVCQSCHAAGSLGVTVEAIPKNGVTKIGANHLGAKHDTNKNGGQFCWDCHDGHGDGNVFMIQAAVAKTSDLTTGAPLDPVATVFTAFGTGTDYATSSEPYTGICQVCHTATTFYNPLANGHYTDKCTLCHPHARGFTPGSDSGKHSEHLAMGIKCEACHVLGSTGLPDPATSTACTTCHQNGYEGTPNDNAYRGHWDAVPYPFDCTSCHSKPPAYTNSPAKANSHAAHSGNTCDKCHAVTTTDGNTIASSTAHGNQVYDVDPAVGLTLTYTYSATGGTCATISCHGNNTATWGGSSLTCQSCHLGAVDAPDVDDFGDTFYDNDVAAKIADTAGWSTTGHGRPTAADPYPSGNAAANFTVSNACLYCHDNTISHKTAANPFRLRSFADETWGKNGVCQSCHAADAVGVTVDATPRNGAVKIGSNHHGTKHGATNNGGQFCWDCHDAHGDSNKYMIHAAVAKTSDATTGVPTSMVATEFTASSTGADYAKATANGICQVCHTSTTYYNPTANGHHTEEGATSKCTNCHAHSDGRGFGGAVSGQHSGHLLMGAACDDCHIAGSKGLPDPLTSTKCNTCHQDGKQGGPNDGGEYRNHWTDVGYALTCNSCHKGRQVVGDMVNTAKYIHIPAADSACDSCHDGAVDDTNYTHLPADANCVTCHDGPGGNALTNFKAAPVGMQTAGHTRLTSSKWIRQYRCHYCHADTTNTGAASDTDIIRNLKAAHLSGTINVNIDSQWAIVNKPAPEYIPATQTCLNVYCHSDGTTIKPEMRDYAWTGGHQECNSCHGHQPSSGGCNATDCHTDGRNSTYWDKFPEKKWLSAMPMYQNTGPLTDKANSHYRHLFTGFSCDDCHAGTISGGGCLNCHGTTIPSGNMTENKHINPLNHVNRSKNVAFKNGGTYATDTKTCSNTACHTGANPQWGGSIHDAIVCRECHGTATADVDDFGKFNDTRAKINLNQWATSGHGRPGVINPATGKPALDTNRYPSGNPPANFPDNGCWYCHDSQVLHQNEERPFRLVQHKHFEYRFEKECVFCHMQGIDSECLTCHNASESLAPQLSTIHAVTGEPNAPYTISQPEHSGYTGGGCSADTCHTLDSTRHRTDAGAWTAEKKDDVKNAYVQMGVCLKCHDDDRSGECATCHQAPADNLTKYDAGFDPASNDLGLVGKTAGKIAPQKAKASSFHFGYKHYQDYTNSLGDQLASGAVSQASTSSREVIDTSQAWTQDAFIGRQVTITSGANNGLSRSILRNSATTLTVSPPFPNDEAGHPQQVQVGDGYKIMDVVWKGGKFCWDCHDPHGDDNIYMIQNKVATRTDGVVGKPIEGDRREVSFTRKSSGLDYARIAPPYNGICNVCHTDNTMHYTDSKGNGHNSGRICTECHEHRFTDSHGSGQACNTCHPNRPVPRHTAFSQARDCTKCHKDTIGNRMNIMRQFSSNSHHVQVADGQVTNKHCYACHWEATPEGVINLDKHAGYNYKNHSSQKDAAVDLVIWQAETRPTTYDPETATTYLANKIDTTKPDNSLVTQRAQVDNVSKHCLGCHSDQNNNIEPFNLVDPTHGDCKTPIQYAWDRASIGSRYSNTGTATFGKYTTTATPNAAKKDITKAFSAHGNAVANQGGINATTGVDGTPANTREGIYNIQCFDCHSSHGSMVGGITSSYTTFNGTKNGANLKETQAGKGGYAMSYMATANPDPNSVNPYQTGAGQCFDCHETASTNTTLSPLSKSPWGYTETFGATERIKGYRDNPRFLGPYSGASQFAGYRASKTTNGGHFKASSALQTAAMGTIDGLCTPCHDPHGISPSLGDKKAYALPLLKGTWLTSPYKEDGPPSEISGTFGNAYNQWPSYKPYPNRANPQLAGVWRTDRNTFNMTDLSVKANQPVAYGQVTEDAETFAGLCLSCHPKGSLTTEASTQATADVQWKSNARIHRSVKGWGATDGQTPREHAFTCSKCHQPHASGLPRLLQTNCLNGQHRGKVASGGAPTGNRLGSFPYGWWDNGLIEGWSTSICHGAATANGPGGFPSNQRWNSVTTWPANTTTGGQ